MLTGRGEELNFLNRFYEKAGSQMIVVYGQTGVGKTRLIQEFTEDKPFYYYACRECSEREQRYLWGQELSGMKTGAGWQTEEQGLHENRGKLPEPLSWPELFASGIRRISKKQVLVLDEFQYLVKNSKTFMEELISFVNGSTEDRELLVILISSSLSWVENSMVKRMGASAFSLSAFLKIRPLDFYKIRRAFPGYSSENAISLYAVLGGFPGLWKHMSPEKSLKENICENILSESGPLSKEGLRILSEELRELNVYQTILAALAKGLHKLNDIYAYTGFSRAKISVYLKNLMELELIEKVFSYDTEGRENAQKGVYRIRNHFIYFYFAYLYPYRSRLETGDIEDFYAECVYPTFRQYAEVSFKEICRTYLLQGEGKAALPFDVSASGEWIGKQGSIDLILQGPLGETIVCGCNWEKPMFLYEDYKELVQLSVQAKLEIDSIWLFSGGRFDERLHLEAKMKEHLRLVPLLDVV